VRIGAAILHLLLAWPLAAQAQESAPMALHLLDYIAVDYAGAVHGGRVSSEDEYREMTEFAGAVASIVKALPAGDARGALETQSARLVEQIARKADPAEVTSTATGLRDAIVRALGISVTPARPPDVALGAKLFAQQCAACHGADGRGDGPAAKALAPAPSNFHDAERMSQRSLFSLYNTVTLGVKGTAMPAFATLREDERWALAAHVASFTKKEAPPASHPPPLEFAAERLAASLEAYRAGDRAQATRLAIQAYLEGFELVEKALSHVDAELMARSERAMMEYRRLVQAGAPAPEVEKQLRAIESLLAAAREKLEGASMSATATFSAAFLILLREGLEAVLVLAAIFAFLGKTGRTDARRYVHLGWTAALALGGLTWFVSSKVIAISGAGREVTEGVTALVSAAMLLYVGFWLHDKAHTAAWQQFIRTQVGGALSSGTVWTLATVSFLAVYREVFETVLFYQALAAQAGPEGHAALVAGVIAGFAVLLAVTWGILRWSARLPLGLFFTASAILLAVLAVVFTGQGIAALQEASWVESDSIGSIRVPMLGIFPTLQTLGAQAAVSILIVAGLSWARKKAS
jgi:high-affinity iron transporter